MGWQLSVQYNTVMLGSQFTVKYYSDDGSQLYVQYRDGGLQFTVKYYSGDGVMCTVLHRDGGLQFTVKYYRGDGSQLCVQYYTVRLGYSSLWNTTEVMGHSYTYSTTPWWWVTVHSAILQWWLVPPICTVLHCDGVLQFTVQYCSDDWSHLYVQYYTVMVGYSSLWNTTVMMGLSVQYYTVMVGYSSQCNTTVVMGHS